MDEEIWNFRNSAVQDRSKDYIRIKPMCRPMEA